MRLRKTSGFTMMELMIVVAILGILSAIAIPTFSMLRNRSKTAEVATNLNSMFKSAAAYYQGERGGKVLSAAVTGGCIVSDAGPNPTSPAKDKQQFRKDDASFIALGYTISDFVYYSYSLHSPGAGCSHGRDEASLYTFTAHGDLDGDLIFSTFELAVGTNGDNQLYHSVGYYVNSEME